MRPSCLACSTMVVIGVWMTAGPRHDIAGRELAESRRCPLPPFRSSPRRRSGAARSARRRRNPAWRAPAARAADARIRPRRGQAEHGHLDAGLAKGRSLAVLALVERLEVVDELRRATLRRAVCAHAPSSSLRAPGASSAGRSTIRGETVASKPSSFELPAVRARSSAHRCR